MMILIVSMWREMTELRIVKDNDGVVSICMDCNSHIESFIDIYTKDKSTPSLFTNVEDAVTFAEILVKLLKVILDGS